MSEQVKSQNWSQVVTQIKKSFSRMTDKNIESLGEKIEMLPSKLESVYGYAAKEAQKEFEKFKLTLEASSNHPSNKLTPNTTLAGPEKVRPQPQSTHPSQNLNSGSVKAAVGAQKSSHPSAR